MARQISIPVDVCLVTILVKSEEVVTKKVEVGKKDGKPQYQIRRERVEHVSEVTPGKDGGFLSTCVNAANGIWKAASVALALRQPVKVVKEAMPDNKDAVDDKGLSYLSSKYPAKGCISIFVAKKLLPAVDEGKSIEKDRTFVIRASSEAKMGGRWLAHELGHLLGLLDEQDRLKNRTGPSHQMEWLEARRNLMYGLATVDSATSLRPDQIQKARKSQLGLTFGGP